MSAPAHAPARTRSQAELRALAAEGAALGDLDADEALQWLVERVGTNLAVASSMADGVLPHLVSTHVPGVDVVFLDTGYHFVETIIARDDVAARLPVRVIDVRPDLSVQEQDRAHGKDLFATDPGRCCELRKMIPLARTLSGYDAWLSGVRRAESAARATTPVITFDERHGLIKVNPLATWTEEQTTAYAVRHAVPLNLLLSEGYPSIGCQPCTRRVAPGDDPRSGRWAGLAKTECGIHT